MHQSFHAMKPPYRPVPPYLLQPPPYQRVEGTQRHDGDQQSDEEGADHVVTEEVSQGVSWRHRYDDLLPVMENRC